MMDPKTISVKGGAERDFTSDLLVWNVTLRSHADTPLYGLKDVERQQKIFRSFWLPWCCKRERWSLVPSPIGRM